MLFQADMHVYSLKFSIIAKTASVDETLKIAQTSGVNELFLLAKGPKGLSAGALDYWWNRILSNLLLFSERLEDLGFKVIGGEVILADSNDAQLIL